MFYIKTFLAFSLPFCLEPILTVGTPKYDASLVPTLEFPTIH